MDIRTIPGLTVSLLAAFTWKYYLQDHQTYNNTNALPEEHLQKIRMEVEKILNLTRKKTELGNMTEEDELQPQREPSVPDQKDALFLKYAFRELSHDQIILIPLIYIFGAGLFSTVSSVFQTIISTGLLVELVFGYMIANNILKTLKSEIEELIRKNVGIHHDPLNTGPDQLTITEMEATTEPENQTDRFKDLLAEAETKQIELQTELENQTGRFKAVLAEAVSKQMEIKTELENQMDRVKQRLEEVEREREFNKQRLQAVENEIIEKEKTFEKPEKLISDKENFLKDQWKLDETKKDCKRQLLNMEKLLEPIEDQIAWLCRKQEAEQVS